MSLRLRVVLLSLLGLALWGVACTMKASAPLTIDLSSAAFVAGQTIPQDYTCDGEDLSPSLAWTGVPSGTQSLTLIMDDPDAPGGTWVHWVLFNLSAQTTGLPSGVEKVEYPSFGGVQGTNSFGMIGYRGPCPPKGSEHRYVFKLYALDIVLNLEPGAKKSDIEKVMQGHVLAQGELIGKFGR